MKHKILIIAGSDPSGGAGIQADIKTATTLKTYSAAAITCLTVQNTQKVFDIFYPPAALLGAQIAAVLDDIKIDVIKTGMLGNAEIATEVARVLKLKAKNIPLIIDPVMVSTSRDSLLTTDSVKILKEQLIANSFLTTPNIFEAEMLADMKIKNLNDVAVAAKQIQKIGVKNVLIKGGHLDSGDRILNYLLKENGEKKVFSNKKLPFDNIHGTGCTLANAISCLLIKNNFDLEDAVKKANLFVYRTIKNSQNIGKGSRVLRHF